MFGESSPPLPHQSLFFFFFATTLAAGTFAREEPHGPPFQPPVPLLAKDPRW